MQPRRHENTKKPGDHQNPPSLRVFASSSLHLSRWSSGQQVILLVAVAAEVVVFSFIAQNFLTAANFFEVMRVSVELGLLALALTPIIITSGIDLSVGSMM